MEKPRWNSGRKGGRDRIWSLSSIVGAVAVAIYIAVVTLRVLRTGVEEGAFGSTIFFLIIGAAILYFLAAIVTSSLADLLLKVASWIERPGTKAESQSAGPPEERGLRERTGRDREPEGKG